MKKRETQKMEDHTRDIDGGELRRELRRAAAWVALVLAAVVAAYYLVLTPLLAPLKDPLDPRASRWEEDAYVNRALGLRFTLPEGWRFEDPADWDEAAEAAEDMGAEDGGEVLLMAAHGPGGVNAQIRCTRAGAGEADAGALRQYVDDWVCRLPVEDLQSEWGDPQRIGPVTYETLYVRGTALDLDMETCVLAGIYQRHVAMVFLTGSAALEPEQYLAALSAS